MKCMRIGGMFLVTLVVLASAWPCSASMQWQQVLSFDFDSVRHIENGPLFRFPPVARVETRTLHFDPFDPALGRLTNAFLSYEGTYAFEYVVKAGLRPKKWYEGSFGQTCAGLADYTFGLSLTAPGDDAPLGSTIHSERTTTYAIGYCISDKYGTMYVYDIDGSGPKGPPRSNNQMFDVDGSYRFQPWVTSGSLETPILSLTDGLNVLGDSVDVDLHKSITQFIMPIFSSSVDPAWSSLDNYLNRWYGNIALTYEYEPIPAPASALLVSTGLAGLAAIRRARPARPLRDS
ncbi:MAG TPA: hypothetical protein VLI39_06145 [Sedimentisphaerales bacterium]|nr:hypothetical protein [Sedimentisphaerales bacterium]